MRLIDAIREGSEELGLIVIMNRQSCIEELEAIEKLIAGLQLAISAYKTGGMIASEAKALEKIVDGYGERLG